MRQHRTLDEAHRILQRMDGVALCREEVLADRGLGEFYVFLVLESLPVTQL